MKQDYFIYKYEWPDGSVYIGQSAHGRKRYKKITSYKNCPKVYSKMQKHPIFESSIIEDNISENDIDNREIYWIKYYNSFYKNNKLGLNLTTGGESRKILSEESRYKMSIAKKGKHISVKTEFPQKKVKCIELNITFDSCSDAARFCNLKNNCNISAVCKGYQNTAGGYHWRYTDV